MANYLAKLFNFYTLGLLGKTGLGKKLGLGSDPGLGRVFESVVDKYTGAGLTGAEQEQNAWNAQQADIAYQRQIDFYNQFQSPDAMVKQYQDAGLNPALMYGKGASAASPISAPQASGSGGTSQGDLISGILSLVSMKQQIENFKVDRALKGQQKEFMSAQTDLYAKQAKFYEDQWELQKELGQANIANIKADTAYKVSQEKLNDAQIDKTTAETAILHWQELIQRSDSEYRDRLNDALLALRNSENELNESRTANTKADTAESKQRLKELEDSYNDRMNQIHSLALEAAEKAGIAAKENYNFLTDKQLNALLIQSECIQNYKLSGPMGIQYRQNPWFMSPMFNGIQYGDPFSVNPSIIYGSGNGGGYR